MIDDTMIEQYIVTQDIHTNEYALVMPTCRHVEYIFRVATTAWTYHPQVRMSSGARAKGGEGGEGGARLEYKNRSDVRTIHSA